MAKSFRQSHWKITKGFDFSVKMEARMLNFTKKELLYMCFFEKFASVLTNLTTFSQNQATHPQVPSWNFTKFWYQASSYYSEHQMPSSVCIKFILYYQKWRKLPLRISSETSFFSRQRKLSALEPCISHKNINLAFP